MKDRLETLIERSEIYTPIPAPRTNFFCNELKRYSPEEYNRISRGLTQMGDIIDLKTYLEVQFLTNKGGN